jgi:TPR repeat protein
MEEEIPAMLAELVALGCPLLMKEGAGAAATAAACDALAFDVATARVFTRSDPEGGCAEYRNLAAQGNLDAVVAVGVVLLEGIGMDAEEAEAVQWLQRASDAGSVQGQFELGSCYYLGVSATNDNSTVVAEDNAKAYELLDKAALHNHTGGLFLTADLILEGEHGDLERDGGLAVERMYKAADQGHRYARQRVRELLRDGAASSRNDD